MAVSTDETTEYSSKILSEKRKAKKPLMEKMRRARINDSLNELKSLVLQLLNKDASRYSKMEKADILEMSVQYLKEMRRHEHSQSDGQSISEYRAGFNYCAQEITKNLATIESSGTEKLRTNLLSHLASCCQGNKVNRPVPGAFTAEDRTVSAVTGVPVPSVWVYPSPPPSPLYMSPPVSPTLPQGSTDKRVLSCAASHLGKIRTLKECKSAVRSQSQSQTQLWRPW